MAYDSVLVLAIWMLVAFAVLSLFGVESARTVEGEAVRLNPWYRGVLLGSMLLSAYAFFAWFWTHGGQTLGMQAWKIRVQNADGSFITAKQALVRCSVAPFSLLLLGLGFVHAWFDEERRTVHDLLSGSAVMQLRYPK